MFLISNNILKILKKNGMITLITSSQLGKKVFGFITKAFLLILLGLITCTCSGLKLTSGHQTFGSQIDYSLFSGKLVRQIHDPMGCVTLRTGVPGFLSWPQERWLTWQPYQVTVGMVYYPSPVLMQRRCSQIRWYPYRLIIPSFSNRPRTEWTVQRPNLPTVSQPPNLPDAPSPLPPMPTKPYNRNYRDLTPPSIGRTPVTTPTMGRNLNSSSMMNRGSGRSPTTSSTTGGLRKPH